jgi:hypothetical protein
LIAGDFFAEVLLSLLDRRHRFVFYGTFDTPHFLGKLRFASPSSARRQARPSISRLAAPIVNLDMSVMISPFLTATRVWLAGESAPPQSIRRILQQFRPSPNIGQTGNLPRMRTTDRGFIFDLNTLASFS